MKTHDVAVVGEVYIDHIFTGFAHWPQPGEEVFTRHYAREVGGGAVNTACALARLGRSVRLFGVIGAADGEWFESRLRAFNVSGEMLEQAAGNTGVTVSISMRDDRSFFSYSGENEKLAPMLRSQAMLASLKNGRHVHFAMPLAQELAMDLLPALRAAGCTTSLDVGFQAEWLGSPAKSGNLPCRGLSVSERKRSLPVERRPGRYRVSFLRATKRIPPARREAGSARGGHVRQ